MTSLGASQAGRLCVVFPGRKHNTEVILGVFLVEWSSRVAVEVEDNTRTLNSIPAVGGESDAV